MSLTTQELVGEANTVEELIDALGEEAFPILKAALIATEKQRLYHKTAYLKRQARNKKVEAALAARGIDINSL